ncbi:MAG: 3'-5' exonuclease [Candidatus Peribacteria bacterium]|jgi:DNA polymerase III epsilon subunit-like protein|nr:3'-5' exonuclease [Candidatus Peribacteria bacterium]
MLNPRYKYVGIDFETTGLDTKKDCPIQVGLVEIDGYGEMIDSFDSLIKPTKEITELKNIVKFITKIETAQLVFAPESSEIADQISHFFGDQVIIIGHNINFDLAFLERMLPGVPYYAAFDTFQFAQALVPYPPSYALEILMQHLEDKPLFLQWKTKFGLSFANPLSPSAISSGGEVQRDSFDSGEPSFHDALYDTKSTLALFCYLISYLQQIREKYPVLQRYITKSNTLLKEILADRN